MVGGAGGERGLAAGEGVPTLFMRGRSRPSHSDNVGRDHVGFSQTKQASCAPRGVWRVA